MEKKTIDTLHAMLCGEIEDIAKKGTLSHETLDILKDLIETEKNLKKIKKYQKEEDDEWREVDRGYSQRKYFIDADYDPYNNAYNRGMDRGQSYGYTMGRVYDGGNSYMYRDPRYDQMMGYRYSRTGSKSEMVEELHKMMEEATDESTKKAISEAISKIK